MDIKALTVASVDAEVLVLAEKGSTVTMSGSTIQSSSFTSVTDARGGSILQVLDTTVSNMQALEDAFIGSGADTRVVLTRVTVENNMLRDRWRVLNVRDGANGSVIESVVERNTNLQFGFTASSSDTVLLIDDSFINNNFGLGVSTMVCCNVTAKRFFSLSTLFCRTRQRNSTSAPVITLLGAITSIERTEFNGNGDFTVSYSSQIWLCTSAWSAKLISFLCSPEPSTGILSILPRNTAELLP